MAFWAMSARWKLYQSSTRRFALSAGSCVKQRCPDENYDLSGRFSPLRKEMINTKQGVMLKSSSTSPVYHEIVFPSLQFKIKFNEYSLRQQRRERTALHRAAPPREDRPNRA